MRERLTDAAPRVPLKRSIAPRQCDHPEAVRDVPPGLPTCPSCDEQGSEWVRLRMCLGCGVVGCCDSSPGQHARVHFEATGHPVMRSIEPGESWAWCYPHQAYLGLMEMTP